MGRKAVGWQDESVQSGFSDRKDKERQYRAKKGRTDYMRVMSSAEEYRTHSVPDVAFNKEGEAVTFNIICSKEWDDKKEDYVGECLSCDKDYEVSERFICGVIFLGSKKGKRGSINENSADNAPYYWDFGNDKYVKLREMAMRQAEAEPPKKLSQVELVVTCTDDGFQKIEISKYEGKRLTTKDHIAEYKEQGEDLIDEAVKPPSVAEQKRRLKSKKPKKKADEDLFGDEDDGDEPEEKPKKKARKSPAKARKKKEPEPEPEDEDEDDDDLDGLLDELDD